MELVDYFQLVKHRLACDILVVDLKERKNAIRLVSAVQTIHSFILPKHVNLMPMVVFVRSDVALNFPQLSQLQNHVQMIYSLLINFALNKKLRKKVVTVVLLLVRLWVLVLAYSF